MIGATPALLRLHRCLVVLGCVGLLSRASAQSQSAEPQAFRVTFRSVAGCGSAEEFEDEVLKRTDLLRVAAEGEAALALDVELERSPEGIQGRLTLRETDGHLAVRDVPGGDCEEVLSAMALIAALTVDPLARPDREVPIAARRPAKPPDVENPPPKPRPPPPRVTPRREPPKAAAPQEPVEPEPSHGPEERFGIGQRITVQTAVMPGATLGLSAHAELALAPPSLLSPRIRLSGIFSRSGSIEATRGRADFDWITARLQVCPVRFGLSRAWNIRPCTYFDVGRLRGQGYEIEPSREKQVLWTAAGAELSAEARLAGPLRLGAEAGILLPFRRDRFLFEPNTELHEVPAAGFSAGIGLGLLFF